MGFSNKRETRRDHAPGNTHDAPPTEVAWYRERREQLSPLASCENSFFLFGKPSAKRQFLFINFNAVPTDALSLSRVRAVRDCPPAIDERLAEAPSSSCTCAYYSCTVHTPKLAHETVTSSVAFA